MPKHTKHECAQPDCEGPGKLRQFLDWHDLDDHANRETILKWVNHYAQMIEARDSSGAKYRKKQQLMAQLAKRVLDPDELERIEAEAQRRAEERT